MKISRQSIAPAVRLARSYAAAAPKLEVEYEAESSTAAQRRQGSDPESQTYTRILNPTSKPRRRPKATALLRAQKFAKALESTPPPSKADIPLPGTPPPPPPTLADLEAKKPDREPPSMSSQHYDRLYKKLFRSVDKAFVARQLYEFGPQLGVKLRRGRNKEMVIRGILKIWGWEDPEAFVPEKVHRKVTERDWMLTKAELWLIMRDASVVRPAMDEGVSFSIPPVEGEVKVDTGMRTLRGNGSAIALMDLDQRIKSSRDLIAQHTRLAKSGQTGVEKKLSVLSTISNASGAYLEPILGGSIRVSALDPVQAEAAVSLLDQYNSYTTSQSRIPLNLITPSPTLEMSLFPHIPSSISSVPWQSIDKLASPLFRVRGVQPWETKVGMRGVAHREEQLGSSGSYRITGLDNSAVEGVSLSERVATNLLAGEGVRTVARFGHLVFADPNSDASILSPSDRSRFTAESISASSIHGSKPVLLPTLPPSLIQYPIEGPSRTIRRLRYQSQTSGQYCDITYTVPPPPTPTPQAETPADGGSGWHQELDEMMAGLEVEEESVEAEEQPVEQAGGETAEEASPAEQAGSEVVGEVELDMAAFEARVGQEKAENFIMPDRPIDYTMSTSNAALLDLTQIPQSALRYLNSPSGLAPTTLELQDQTWSLITEVEQIILETDLSPQSPIDQLQGVSPTAVTLRSISSTDLTFGAGRVVRYAELETTGEVSPVFWEQLAVWTRAVAPGAGSLRSAVY